MSDSESPAKPDDNGARFGFGELERAILDMTVTLCQQLSYTYNNAQARDYVATYLEDIASNIRALPDNTPSATPDNLGVQE